MSSKAKNKIKSNASQRNSKGASRKTIKSRVVSTGLIRKVFKTMVSFSLVAVSVYGFQYFKINEKWNNFYQKPITHIQIDGQFLYLSYEWADKKVKATINNNFLDVDLVIVKEQLEQNPWIDTVSVAKKWPDKLFIKITEQQPIARWGQQGFLNMRGDIIRVENNESLAALPLLSGEDQYATQVMQHYLRMGKVLAQAELTLGAVELDETQAWTLTLEDEKVIKLGRDLIWEKLQYLITAKKTVLAGKFEGVKGIDLRYHNGMAISWIQSFQQPAIAQN